MYIWYQMKLKYLPRDKNEMIMINKNLIISASVNPWTNTMQKKEWNKGEQNIKDNSEDFKDLGTAQRKVQ